MADWWYKTIDLLPFTHVELTDEDKGKDFIIVSDTGRKNMTFHGFRENIDYNQSYKQKKWVIKDIDTKYGSFTDKKNNNKYFLLLSTIHAYPVDEIQNSQMNALTSSQSFSKLPEDVETNIRGFGGRKSRTSRASKKSRKSRKSRASKKSRTTRK
jgi:hypothetical protein